MVTVEEVEGALREVIDPELGLDFVELGLIYDISVSEGGNVVVIFTLTTPGCPIGGDIEEQIIQFVSVLPGVTSVDAELVFSPPWSTDLMSDDAKFAFGYSAY